MAGMMVSVIGTLAMLLIGLGAAWLAFVAEQREPGRGFLWLAGAFALHAVASLVGGSGVVLYQFGVLVDSAGFYFAALGALTQLLNLAWGVALLMGMRLLSAGPAKSKGE